MIPHASGMLEEPEEQRGKGAGRRYFPDQPASFL